jgi:hypothetical protein
MRFSRINFCPFYRAAGLMMRSGVASSGRSEAGVSVSIFLLLVGLAISFIPDTTRIEP